MLPPSPHWGTQWGTPDPDRAGNQTWEQAGSAVTSGVFTPDECNFEQRVYGITHLLRCHALMPKEQLSKPLEVSHLKYLVTSAVDQGKKSGKGATTRESPQCTGHWEQ